jgi:hypothetical protein
LYLFDFILALLDKMPEPTLKEQILIFGCFKFLPQLFRYAIKSAATFADEQLPPIPRGRPGLATYTKMTIVECVSNHYKRDASLERSKKLAAERFGVSVAMVQRTWDDRTNIEEADFRSVLKLIHDEVNSN